MNKCVEEENQFASVSHAARGAEEPIVGVILASCGMRATGYYGVAIGLASEY